MQNSARCQPRNIAGGACVYDALTRRAAEAGISVPEYLRKETERLAARPTVNEWLDRTRRRADTRTRRDTLEALDELRGA